MISGTFVFKLLEDGSLFGRFSSDYGLHTELCIRFPTNKNTPFLGSYFSTWVEDGKKLLTYVNKTDTLTISVKIGAPMMYELRWEKTKFVGTGFVVDSMLVGSYCSEEEE